MRIGIEQLAMNPPAFLRERRLALLCNQASTDRDFRHSRDIVQAAFPGQLTCLFSPQHGFFSEKQDNMVESGHGVDPVSGLPVYSLYAEQRRPTPEMFAGFDVLLVDLIDVGTRVYTFVWTVVHCLQTAAQTGRQVVILDRPNPIGGHLVEGNLLKPEWSSFVGLHPLPMRHGLTLGELALLCNREMGIGAALEVIRCEGWQRNRFMDEALFPWVFPSPNMPSLATALVYPGQVLWEGTNVSEGRGTTLPFLLCGAPYLKHREIEGHLARTPLPGCVLRPLVFEPTSGKWSGQPCAGFQLHVTDPHAFRPYRTSLALYQALFTLYPGRFAYKVPPYEYEFERLPMDLILGDQEVRLALEAGADILELECSWQEDLAGFAERACSVFLYDGE
ncbi:MAG: exo-beta-N-acetylmuramidase NamZ family protein [Desulfobulbaceae bacterium]